MSDTAAGSRRIATGIALAFAAAAIALPRAEEAHFGLAPGDVTLALRFAAVACGTFAATVALAGLRWRAVALAACCACPALAFVPSFPASLAPLALVPLFAALLRSRSKLEAALLATLAAECQLLGAAGWIFHYFDQPWLPGLIAFTLAGVLWAPIGVAVHVARRSLPWLPVLAVLVPLTERIRGEWMQPPLPGLTMAHAVADTALAALVPFIGEFGIAWLVAIVGLCGARLLASERLRYGFAPRVAALLLASTLLGANRTSESPAGRTDVAPVRVCAVRDPTRTGGGNAFGDGGDAMLFAIAARANELDCALVVFPEYSLELTPAQVLPADWGIERLAREPTLIGGAFVEYGQSEEPRRWLRNIVCRLHLGPGRQINCAGGFDKLVFAPFGEAGLFQDVPWLTRLGAWASLQAMGAKFAPLRSIQPVGVLPIGGGRRAGVAICWEILVPHIFERRGVRGRGDVDLLAVVSDLDGFGGSQAAIDHFRRAAVLHALSLDAPLLFASTNDPFLVSAQGTLVPPVHAESFVVAWNVKL